LALVGGIVTSTVFVAAGAAPAGAAGHLSPQGGLAPPLARNRGVLGPGGGGGGTGGPGPRPGPRGAARGARGRGGRRRATGGAPRAPPGDSRSCRRSRDVIVQPYAARAGRVRARNLRAGPRVARASGRRVPRAPRA